LIMITMMGSDLQSTKRCGNGCHLCGADQRATRYGRSIASTQLLAEYITDHAWENGPSDPDLSTLDRIEFNDQNMVMSRSSCLLLSSGVGPPAGPDKQFEPKTIGLNEDSLVYIGCVYSVYIATFIPTLIF